MAMSQLIYEQLSVHMYVMQAILNLWLRSGNARISTDRRAVRFPDDA